MEEQNNQQLQYGGKCAFAVSLGKSEVAGLEKYKLIKEGKTYYFSNPIAKFLFKILPSRQEKADKCWEDK